MGVIAGTVGSVCELRLSSLPAGKDGANRCEAGGANRLREIGFHPGQMRVADEFSQICEAGY